MKIRPFHFLLPVILLLTSCANFRRLASDLKPFQNDSRISGIIENSDQYDDPVVAVVLEWDTTTGRIFSADRIELTKGGTFIFSVESPLNQQLGTFADKNHDGLWQAGEAPWMHEGPLALGGDSRKIPIRSHLAASTRIPLDVAKPVDAALADRTVEESITHRGVRFVVGEVADLDEPRFSTIHGKEGLWTPVT